MGLFQRPDAPLPDATQQDPRRKLHQQWPRVGPGDLVNVAEALQREDRWKGLDPADAALEWLRQGIPAGDVAKSAKPRA
jgi:hypothetical protein